jgi:hypothetical protein
MTSNNTVFCENCESRTFFIIEDGDNENRIIRICSNCLNTENVYFKGYEENEEIPNFENQKKGENK